MATKLGNLNEPEYTCAYGGCTKSILDDAYTCPECNREFCADHADPKAHECGTASSLKSEMIAYQE